MGQARALRDSATRCLRLSRSIECPDDVAWLTALAAGATQAADQIEADETVGLAKWHSSCQMDGQFARPGSFEDFDATTDRDAKPGPYTLWNRRRSGRQDVNSVLIPLLRDEHLAGLPGDPADRCDQLSASRGIVIWTMISAAVWAPLLWWVL